jgi:rod shape-determining protein MreD
MGPLSRNPWWAASLLVPVLLTLAAPGWPRLAGVAPAWALLWLLPWALMEGRLSGALAGGVLGLLLDSLHPNGLSELPALALLGWWWGRLGRQGPPVERSFNLALLVLLGGLVLDGSLMLQALVRSSLGRLGPALPGGAMDPALLAQPGWHPADLLQAGPPLALARILLTALLAPVLCSLQMVLWRHQSGGWRR